SLEAPPIATPPRESAVQHRRLANNQREHSSQGARLAGLKTCSLSTKFSNESYESRQIQELPVREKRSPVLETVDMNVEDASQIWESFGREQFLQLRVIQLPRSCRDHVKIGFRGGAIPSTIPAVDGDRE